MTRATGARADIRDARSRLCSRFSRSATGARTGRRSETDPTHKTHELTFSARDEYDTGDDGPRGYMGIAVTPSSGKGHDDDDDNDERYEDEKRC